MRTKDSPARANGTDALSDAERTHAVRVPRGRPRPREIGRLRLPVTLHARPWATLFELADGRRVWCVRLWDEDRAVRRCFTTGYLLAFARLNGLDTVRASIEEVDRRE